jgi:putative membrane protein
MASMVGKKFGSELTNKLNTNLNKKRWEVLLDKLESSSVGLKNLKQGAFQLREGAQKLDDGSGLLAKKNAELSVGLQKIQDGARRIKDGAEKLKTETAKIPLVGAKVSGGAAQLENGLEQLIAGLVQATDGSKKLTEGAEQIHDGIGKVHGGLDLMYSKIPSKVDLPEGDAEGLAASVSMNAMIDNSSVSKNGVAFTPYFVALSLWVGAIMLTFIFQLQHLPASVKEVSQFKKLATKFGLALPVLFGQSLLITISLALVLKVELKQPLVVWFIAFCGSITFFAIVLALITILSDVGRVVALIFLIFQLGAAGGAFPVELSGGVFAQAHSYLPITDVMKALRAVLFGTYNGEWYVFIGKLLLIALVALALAWGLGRRWLLIKDEDYKPAINV